MRRLAAVLIVLAVAAGCSRRARLNPFDPGNPQTGGRPIDFVALAGSQSVTLRWNPTTANGIVGYQIDRRVGDSTVWRALTGVLPPYFSTWRDFGLADGVDHHYRIAYVFAEGTSPLTAEDVATPGPLIPWVADVAGGVAQLSADGRHVAARVALFRGAAAVDVDPAHGTVWACSPDGGGTFILDPLTGQPLLVNGLQPVAVVVRRSDHTAWIADYQGGYLAHVNPDATPASPPSIAGLDGPLDVAQAPQGDLWVCERNGDRVRRFDALGTPTGAATVIAPSRVAVDSATREAWITSFQAGTVIHLGTAPSPVDTIAGLAGPIGIAVDPRRHRVWVAEAVSGAVDVYDTDGTRLLRVTGLSEPRAIALDLETGNAWVAEHGAGGVSVLSPSGQRLRRLTGIGEPWAIALDDLRLRESGLRAR